MTKIGWIVAAAIAFVLLLSGGVTALVLASGGDPTTVEEVADAAVAAAEDLDVDAGIDLLCDAPSSKERDGLTKLIESAQDRADSQHPDVTYDISKVEGGRTGSFRVHITSDDQGLDGEEITLDVAVERRGDRSCIADAVSVD